MGESVVRKSVEPLLEQIVETGPDTWSIANKFFTTNTVPVSADIMDYAFLSLLPHYQRHYVSWPIMAEYLKSTLASIPDEGGMKDRFFQWIDCLKFQRTDDAPKSEYLRAHELGDVLLENANKYSTFFSQIRESLSRTLEKLRSDTRLEKFEEEYGELVQTDMGHALSPLFSTVIDTVCFWDEMISGRHLQSLKTNILVVDDENPHYWYARFNDRGYCSNDATSAVFHNPTDAIKALRGEQYGLILVDWELGKDNGLDFAETAYKIQESKGIQPLIVLMSYNKDISHIRSPYITMGVEDKCYLSSTLIMANLARLMPTDEK